MDQQQRNKLLLAIKRCIAAKFDLITWNELADYLGDEEQIIYNHPRLLRSLSFGDDDYESHIWGVVADLVKINPENLQAIIEYIDLPDWLHKNYPRDFEELFGHSHLLLDNTDKIAITNSFELNHHIARIRQAIESDPELAIGSVKEMIESVLKLILEANGEIVSKDDIHQLLKKAQKVLKLDPNEIDPDTKGAEIVKRTLNNLGQIIIGIDELRNMYGTGHGRTRKSGISTRHAHLVIGVGATLAIFLMETFEHHQRKNI